MTTIAASLGTALENARLFDETQRLLQETEQHNKELALINSVQDGLARELNQQAIIELVGEKIHEILHVENMSIRLYDGATGLISYPFILDSGVREEIDPHPLGSGIAAHIINNKELLIINRDLPRRMAELGSGWLATSTAEQDKAIAGVPILAGDQTIGTIILASKEEDSISTADMRLLQTLSGSLGVALNNARLYDQTQRRAREMSALVEVGRDISATLELADVLERISIHAQELLQVDSSAVFLPDPERTDVFTAITAIGEIAAELRATEIVSGQGIMGDIARNKVGEVINDTSTDPRAITIAGTEDLDHDHMMVAPLLAADGVRGLMSVWRMGLGREFDQAEELNFLNGLSQQAIIAIENARLYRKHRKQSSWPKKQTGPERLPGQDEPRAAHAAECDHRLHAHCQAQGQRHPGKAPGEQSGKGPEQRRTPAGLDQHDPRHRQDRSTAVEVTPNEFEPQPADR